MKISIVGWYGKNNVGDEAFRLVLNQFFREHQNEFVTPPQRCPKSDVVVLGGGAVASPYYLDTLPDYPRFAVGVDLAYESEAQLMAKANFHNIYVRSQTDCEALKQVVSCPVTAIPDLAFYIQPTGEDVLRKYRRQLHKPAVGVLVTDYVNPAIDRPYQDFGARAFDFKTKMAAELDILSDQGYEIVLIPCSTGGYGDDRRMNLDLAAFMKRPPTNILDTIEPQKMVDIIAGCQFTICQRFHAHIFSMIAGTPFVSIELTRKVKLLLQENGLSQWTGGFYLNKNTFDFSKVQEVVQLFSKEDSNLLKSRANSYRDQLVKVKQQLLQEMSEACS